MIALAEFNVDRLALTRMHVTHMSFGCSPSRLNLSLGLGLPAPLVLHLHSASPACRVWTRCKSCTSSRCSHHKRHSMPTWSCPTQCLSFLPPCLRELSRHSIPDNKRVIGSKYSHRLQCSPRCPCKQSRGKKRRNNSHLDCCSTGKVLGQTRA
jgi:hypothetical protein